MSGEQWEAVWALVSAPLPAAVLVLAAAAVVWALRPGGRRL